MSFNITFLYSNLSKSSKALFSFDWEDVKSLYISLSSF